jgi:hypothetical protein
MKPLNIKKMKQEKNIQTMAESQNRKGIRDASDGSYQTIIQNQDKVKINPASGRCSYRGGINLFRIQTNSKAPPGHARSPGSIPGGQGRNPVRSAHKEFTINNKEELFKIKNDQYSNINNNLNFKVMKKQILLLVMVFLTATTAFGQMIKGSDPQPLSCTPGPFTPMAGVPYDYSATVTPANGNFTWWATKDYDFIKTTGGVTTNNLAAKLNVGTDLIAASPNYGNTVQNANTVNITWDSGILAGTTDLSPTFVVVQNDATGTNCANNLKVYQIKPLNGFTVDIKNMNQAKAPLGYAVPYSLCVSNIESARYSGGAIVTDYGTNVMYFEVVAANFTGSYTPSFRISGLQAGQSVTSLELYTDAAMATPAIGTTLAAGVYSPASPIAVDGSVTNTSTGVSLYVKLTIANGTYETLTDNAVTLAVNGMNAVGEKDVVNTDCATQTDFEDTATQTLTARPTIQAVAPGVFVTP